jgi:hypothetical protein
LEGVLFRIELSDAFGFEVVFSDVAYFAVCADEEFAGEKEFFAVLVFDFYCDFVFCF